MPSKPEKVKRWRKNTKENIVNNMGGCCQLCGYNKCFNALELHHVIPEEKELSFGKIRSNPKSIEIISKELEKCILLCSNCHKEVHAGVSVLPVTYVKFNKTNFIYNSKIEFSKRNSKLNKILDTYV